ncbi:hypothetical protein [Agrobacterium rosae]|uniref:Uncharacterized protein n=1 Tax=Agrobacterium rosae TaxID=1972867 RepID=A0AAW9FQ13_9HYPH|nr:hypothetical protein [Agrobacterium rosae]MDX8305246.1 hypothetical protein [Agrobacterium rosae]
MLVACYLALVAIYGIAGLQEILQWLLIIVAAYTLIETLNLRAIESITSELAPKGKQATYFGALGLVLGVGDSSGNYAGSWLAMERASPRLFW